MSWSRILAPLSGADQDGPMLKAAAGLAAPFEANVTASFAAASPNSLLSWMGEGAMNAVEMAIDALQKSASDGECGARARFEALDYPRKAFEVSSAEDWTGLRASARLSDVVVFAPASARGEGILANAFQHILMDERRPVLVADGPVEPGGLVAVAWDGGREASRAARRAIPFLRKAKEVVILTAPAPTCREFEPGRLSSYLADQGVKARWMQLSSIGEAGPLLLKAAQQLGAGLLVAGAFGHPRLRRFIFGGTTRTLLDSKLGPALFISH
jgi:nucleotide-binding universal stress UspA family protein